MSSSAIDADVPMPNSSSASTATLGSAPQQVASAATTLSIAAAPPIPPRTYPRPPPSNIIPMLLGVARLLKYTAVGTAVLTFIYFTYVLPRLNLVLELRGEMYKHQTKLLLQLQGKLLELKAANKPMAVAESSPDSHDGEEDDSDTDGSKAKIIRDASSPYERAICDILQGAPEHKLPFAALLDTLSSRFAWFSHSPKHYRSIILKTLETSAEFEVKMEDVDALITLKAPIHLATSPASDDALALHVLKDSVARLRRQQTSGGTLQSIVDLTSYISSQTYAYMGSYSSFRPSMSSTAQLAPAEDDIRREIRSLKSLLLNRRSFIPPRIDHRINPT